MLPNNARNFAKQVLIQKNTLNRISAGVTSKNTYATEARFETKPYRLHEIADGPSTTVFINRKDALSMYSQMHTIRRMETSIGNMYKEKIVRGFCHLYSGQEGVAVGINSALRPEDSVITGYRDHGWAYLTGISPLGVIAELAGRQSGCARGKGGSMHMYGQRFYGGNGIVGAQVPLGAGIAFAAKYKGTDGICVAAYGDGAANQGQVFETFNMAKLWNLPCIFVCENNGYGMGTSSVRASSNTDFYKRGDLVPGLWVDGMDVLAVREATLYAINHCTGGKGPIILEAATYRYSGHSMSDPGTSYRSREEIQEVRQTRDPITSFREKIISSNLATLDEIKTIEADIRSSIDEATKKAKADKEIPFEEMTTDIYVNNLEGPIRGTTPFNPLEHRRLNKPKNVS